MKNLRNDLIALALIATGLTSLAATTGSIIPSGTVATSTSITVTSHAGYNTLDIATGFTDTVIASVNEKCNKKNGYTVTLQSANAGSTAQANLSGTGDNTDTVNYSMKYGGTAVTLSSGSATVTSATAKTNGSGVDKDLSVTISSGIWVNTDTYSDTLTLTIAAN